jgi:hypothetical protein
MPPLPALHLDIGRGAKRGVCGRAAVAQRNHSRRRGAGRGEPPQPASAPSRTSRDLTCSAIGPQPVSDWQGSLTSSAVNRQRKPEWVR